mmetsp:Transcript_7829/g.15257  ORF Transcript_7829/g.15257 Transcript_7829/m.15257 type:complete len:215 (-) Transcript_7829:617-1261(-)
MKSKRGERLRKSPSLGVRLIFLCEVPLRVPTLQKDHLVPIHFGEDCPPVSLAVSRQVVLPCAIAVPHLESDKISIADRSTVAHRKGRHFHNALPHTAPNVHTSKPPFPTDGLVDQIGTDQRRIPQFPSQRVVLSRGLCQHLQSAWSRREREVSMNDGNGGLHQVTSLQPLCVFIALSFPILLAAAACFVHPRAFGGTSKVVVEGENMCSSQLFL